MWKDLCKSIYEMNYDDPHSVDVYVSIGVITADDYKEITGIDYVAKG